MSENGVYGILIAYFLSKILRFSCYANYIAMTTVVFRVLIEMEIVKSGATETKTPK